MTIRRSIPEEAGTRPRVVGTGLLALDVLLNEGKTGSRAELGGSAGNVLAILAFLGWSSVPVARLGTDVAGSRIRREFEFLHADTRFIKYEQQARTPVVYQWPGDDQRTHKFSFSCPFCGQKRGFSAEADDAHCHTVLKLIERSDVFYFDRVTSWSLSLAENYRKRGALVVFEPSAMNVEPSAFQRAIDSCHVLKYADERIDELGVFDCTKVDVIIQTLGAEGLRFKASGVPQGSWQTLSAFRVPRVIDTAGAGDWCTAGLLHSLQKAGASARLDAALLSKALRFGQALAALNCMHAGARGLAQQGARERLEELANFMDHREREEVSLTREWQEFCEKVPQTDWTKQRCTRSQDLPAPSARLCCEPLGV
ncbi:PfkB family carbohydrate kinase [Paraburkholderia phenoliruptrix]|uniref:Ribokinase n=1 Tax=Paraburkholderia phenoliruptrix TaxID=252970 RepID=A0A6J5K261_9BURK|nr:PfkB family carbohydrate kinase [Paraburkholderia phenoliruptrix]CAB4048503.1 Ribokinase [Paraburkholderia phenoliruptrix]